MATLPSAAGVPSSPPTRVSTTSQLPRIRASRFCSATETAPAEASISQDDTRSSEDAAGSSVATGVAHDVVSPLSPTASERVDQLHRQRLESEARRSALAADASRPLTRMLRGREEAEQCRWSGLLLIVFYGITVLLWPSLFMAAMGLLCGLSGSMACYEPYTVRKIVWVFAYAYLNIAMIGAIAWTALDQLVLRGDDSDSVNFLYLAAFVILGLVIHVRSFQMAKALIEACKLTPILVEAVVPERWRSVQQPAATNFENENDQELSPHSSRSSSIHSFEIDIQSQRSHPPHPGWSQPQSPVEGAMDSPPSTPRSEPASPVSTSFRVLNDATV